MRIPYARKAKTLPVVLGADEVGRLLEAVEDLTCRVALATAYATGLRTSEVITIRIEHIETARELIRVACGKGAKDRYVMLSPAMLTLLRAYWKVVRPRPWLFLNDAGTGPLSAATRSRDQEAAAKILASDRHGEDAPALLRHDLLEQGADIRVIQVLLGHRQLTTTARYTMVPSRLIAATTSPRDRLGLSRSAPS